MENDIITYPEETKAKSSKFELRKSKTGIQGLDVIMEDGLDVLFGGKADCGMVLNIIENMFY